MDKRTLLTVHVELVGSEPAIWRTLEIDAAMGLDRFHRVLQAALGWTDSHLHHFMDRDPYATPRGHQLRDTRFWQMTEIGGALERFEEDGPNQFPETGETVAGALRLAGDTLWYEYDFGDGWMHTIRLVSERPANVEDPEALVLDGALRVPLEDVGGLHGWYAALEARALAGARPEDPDAAEVAEWIDAQDTYWTPFEPEVYDVGAASSAVCFALGRPYGWDGGDAGVVPVGAPGDFGHLAARWLADLDDYPAFSFAAALHRAGVDPLGEPDAVPASAPVGAAGAVEPFRWLVQACAGDGLPLTAAEYLTPAALRTVIAGLGWEEESSVRLGGKTEVNTHSILFLREAAIRAGLLRAEGRRLVATAAGLRVARSTGSLWSHLVRRAVPRKANAVQRHYAMLWLIVAAEGAASRDQWIDRALEGLGMLGYERRDGEPLTVRDAPALPEPLGQVLRVVGVGPGATGCWSAGPNPVQRAFARAVLES
ncbi:plasmid pRiA4b ORF-3 family protein [Arthrobacter sp. KK5.5]|uniref:plasmid pRiA4b ORF-3 family protein n=1 Tax=Arthrobacter sp. KK5.5 TaxID=3373084 RepID=UPI003EE6E6F0